MFEALVDKVIPKLLEGKGPDDQVRVWVAGCATGEEAYSIAILFKEVLPGNDKGPKLVVFATDIDDRAVAIARAGNYRKSMVRGLSPERLARWFVDDGDFYRPIPEIRESCVFSVHNIVKDPPFSKLALLSCRNLLIYLDGRLQDRLVPIFHYALVPGGTLLLGPSEMVDRGGPFLSFLMVRTGCSSGGTGFRRCPRFRSPRFATDRRNRLAWHLEATSVACWKDMPQLMRWSTSVEKWFSFPSTSAGISAPLRARQA